MNWVSKNNSRLSHLIVGHQLPELQMTREFKEFIDTYEEFRRLYPKHPLIEDLRSGILQRRLPPDEWLRARTLRMKRIIKPPWLEVKQHDNETAEAS
jgi:hypothetical protein